MSLVLFDLKKGKKAARSAVKSVGEFNSLASYGN